MAITPTPFRFVTDGFIAYNHAIGEATITDAGRSFSTS